MTTQPNPSHIMQTATAFWASKVLLTAVEFDLFTTLDEEGMTAEELGQKTRTPPTRHLRLLRCARCSWIS